MTQLENRVLVLARTESTYNVDSILANLSSNPSPLVTDALLCSDFDFKANTSLLERANYNASLSHDNTGVSRVLAQMTFKTEWRGSGVFGTAPRIGRLLKACGMQETIIANTAAAIIQAPVAGSQNSSAASTAIVSSTVKTTPPTSCFDTYTLTCTVGGAPGTSKLMVTGAGFPELDPLVLPSAVHSYAENSALGTIAISGTTIAPVFTFAGTWVVGDIAEIFVGGVRFYYQVASGDTVTTIATALKTAMLLDARFVGTANTSGVLNVSLSTATNSAPGAGDFLTSASAQVVTLGSSGAQITLPAAMGTMTAGESWTIALLRPGVLYTPVSDLFSSVSLWAYVDGALYKTLGARGTFSCDGSAAQFAMLSFTFTGTYQEPIDQPLPTGVQFETSKPWKVELAQLAIFGQANAKASKFAFDIANTVSPKDNINADEAYDEVRITDRQPTCSADPESDKPSAYNPWTRMRRADATRFHVLVGTKGGAGNVCRFQADNVNYTDVPFANRNKIRAFNYSFRCARISGDGNDECFLHFS